MLRAPLCSFALENSFRRKLIFEVAQPKRGIEREVPGTGMNPTRRVSAQDNCVKILIREKQSYSQNLAGSTAFTPSKIEN